MALFIIDFDLTIANGHTNNIISNAIKVSPSIANDITKQWEIFSNVLPVRNAYAWQVVFQNLLADGHQVAIASFNCFGTHIPAYLKQIIGLSEEIVKQVLVISEMPANPNTADKNAHITKIIEMSQFKGPADSVVLIDDSIRNILAAQQKNYRTIFADSTDGLHIDAMLVLSKELKHVNLTDPKPSSLTFFSPVPFDEDESLETILILPNLSPSDIEQKQSIQPSNNENPSFHSSSFKNI